MKEEQKSQLIAEAESVEAIRDFFEEWYSLDTLYETAAKCTNNLLGIINRQQICDEERKDFQEFIDQHLMMIDLLKKFKRNGEK
jgi:predicted RNA binding protein with dsRBD fold (UPF0201 family)